MSPLKTNIESLVATGKENTTQRSFRETPWEDMLERRLDASDLTDERISDAARVNMWLERANRNGRDEALSPINRKKCRWIEDWMEHRGLYSNKTAWPGKKRALSLNWSDTFNQTLNETVELYDGFLCLRHILTLLDINKNISVNQAATDHSHVIPFDARVKWSGFAAGSSEEKVYLESDIAKAVVISDGYASPDFVVLAVACDCIKGDSVEDAITILKAFRGEEVAVAEYIAEGTVSGTGGKDSPLTYATGIGYAKGTSTGNLGAFTVKNPENLRYNRSVARLRSEETAAAYKAGITPRYKILFAVKEALAADPAKLTLTGDATKTRGEDGNPAPLEDNEGGDSLNGYTYVNMAVPLKSATNITPVGSGAIELFRLPPPSPSDKNLQLPSPPPPAKYRLFQADVQAEKALERDIRMGFMDYTWTLRTESKELGTDTSRIGRVFAVFGESTLKCQEPTPGMYKWQLILSKSLCNTLAQSPGSDLALDGNSMDNEHWRASRQHLLSGGFITLTVNEAPALSCRQGASGAYRALTEGRDYACLSIRDMKEAQPPSCERPWIAALETLTRHLLLEKRLRPFNLAWPTTTDLPNAVNVFAYGMHVMTDYNPQFKTAEYRHQVLEYANEAYYRNNGTIIMELNLSKFSRKICGGDHPHVICVEAVGLSYSLLALCGMEYDSLKFLQHPSIAHALLGYGNKIYEATPSLQSPTTNRPQRTPGSIQGEVTTDPPGIRVDGEIYRNLKAILLLSTTRETP